MSNLEIISMKAYFKKLMGDKLILLNPMCLYSCMNLMICVFLARLWNKLSNFKEKNIKIKRSLEFLLVQDFFLFGFHEPYG
jgi:hypothetical protein